MEEKEIASGLPVTVAGIILIPIIKVVQSCHRGIGGISFVGVKQPVAVVVISPQAKRVFTIAGEELSLEQLVKEVPDIKEILARI
jgi:uncharacterized spore protein YtfJ